MSTSYLTLTNNAITESGSDLATFNTSGSDWSTNTGTLQVRFKNWIARAWKEIQQESFDLSFMQETAVVNIDPGVLVYTDGTPILTFQKALRNGGLDVDFQAWWTLDHTSTVADIYSNIAVYDQDGTSAISSLPVKNTSASINSVTGAANYPGLYDLTGTDTTTSPFGYLNLYTTASAPISNSFKPGAEYISLSNSRVTLTFMTQDIAYDSTKTYLLLCPFATLAGSDAYCSVVSVTSDGVGTYTIVLDVPHNAISYFLGSTHPDLYSIDISTGAATKYYSHSGSSTVSLTSTLAPSKMYIHGWKSFNFSEETGTDDFQENIKEINEKTFRIVDYFQAAPTGEVPLTYTPWEIFEPLYDISSVAPGQPRLITRDNQNRFRLYPHPYYKMTLKFDYIRTPQILSAYSDIPEGLDDDYVDMIMWRALITYGEYNEQPSVVARASKNYKNLLFRFEQKYRQKFHFQPHRMW